MVEFEATFTSLVRFTPELMATKEHRCLEFEKRLRPKIMLKVMGYMFRDYDRLVEVTTHVEIMLEAEESRLKHKRSGCMESRGDTRSSKESRSYSSSFLPSSPCPNRPILLGPFL